MRTTLFLAVLVSSACGGGGVAKVVHVDLAGPDDLSALTEHPDLAEAPDLAGDMTEGPPTFAGDVFPILQKESCLDCHMTTPWDGSEALVGSQLVAYLTTTKSEECPSLPYVTPGAPAMSYLYQKVVGMGSCFVDDPMPDGSPGLDTEDAGRIEAWILEGAPAN